MPESQCDEHIAYSETCSKMCNTCMLLSSSQKYKTAFTIMFNKNLVYRICDRKCEFKRPGKKYTKILAVIWDKRTEIIKTFT